MSSGTNLWLIDYDLSTKDSRRQFYRQVEKLISKTDLLNILSTYSVVVVQDGELARTVYTLASKYGKAHLYKAELVA
jgi:hypothetical protein